jgi:hypothetical protein
MHRAAGSSCSHTISHVCIGKLNLSRLPTTHAHTFISSYNLRYQDPSVVEIAFYRAVAVIIGVLWAFIVSQFWWPAEARRELGKLLGE